MNGLLPIINILSEDEKLSFKAYLNSKNKRKDVRNIKLFDMLKTDDINDKKTQTIFASAEAYHAARKRLYDSLITFLGKSRLEADTSSEHTILQLLMASRTLFEHKLYNDAFKCLAKAENMAVQQQLFKILNDIYHTHLQFAHFKNKVNDVDLVIEKLNANKNNIEREEQMNVAYALLRRELHDIYYNGKIVNFTVFIQDTLQKLGVSADALTFKSLYQILFIANEYASINNNYKLVESFMNSAYDFITCKEEKAETQLYYHIYILYLLANMHLRNARFSSSKSFLEKMHTKMLQQGKKYYDRFMRRYSLLVALVENYSGFPVQAIEILQKALMHKAGNETDNNDLRLCLIMFSLQQGNGSEAAKQMLQFGRSDSRYEKHMGMDWAIKKKLTEILLYIHAEHNDYAILRLKGFRKRYNKYLDSVKEYDVLKYAGLLGVLIKNPEMSKSKSYRRNIDDLMEDVLPKGDIVEISFVAWLKAYVMNKSPYEVTMHFLSSHGN